MIDVASHGVKYAVIVPTVYTANAMVELLRSGSEDSKEKAADVLMNILFFVFCFLLFAFCFCIVFLFLFLFLFCVVYRYIFHFINIFCD